MNVTLLVIAIALLLFIAVFAAGYALIQRRPKIRQRVTNTGADFSGKEEDLAASMEKVFAPLGEMIPGRSPEDLRKEKRRLISAGYRQKNAVAIFYGARVAVIIFFLIIFLVMGMAFRNPLLYVLLPVLLGMILPDIWLKLKTASRKEAIQLALPDMMDLSVVCVEAGMGLDQALKRISDELRATHPELADELYVYNLETNAGLPRAQAMRNLASRTDVDDVKALAGTLIQADRFGTSIAQSLRVFSDALRTKRRQRAEEKAAKMSIKIIVPLVLFIFPSIFVVVAGPAIIMLIRNLLPLMQGQ